ncbi:MAG: hypothetical protein HFI05_07730 [Lachnospiraceae bacterium]|nr:hypothetical protein [Lachnospiraceae bacterium]
MSAQIRTKEFIQIICQKNEVEILAEYVGSDHNHLVGIYAPIYQRVNYII